MLFPAPPLPITKVSRGHAIGLQYRPERLQADSERFMEAESAAIVSMVLEVRPEHIAMLKAVIESYDNLATIRTADPVRHH